MWRLDEDFLKFEDLSLGSRNVCCGSKFEVQVGDGYDLNQRRAP